MSSLYGCVQELEDRYYETTMAWEKELRNLINQNKAKTERIHQLESLLHETSFSKNDYKTRYDNLSKDLQILNTSLKSYAYVPANHPPDLAFETMKKVFDDNDRLRSEVDKLLDNIESTRQDYFKVSTTSKSAVQGIPTLLTQ
jgi:chromosome segregation ATPase